MSGQSRFSDNLDPNQYMQSLNTPASANQWLPQLNTPGYPGASQPFNFPFQAPVASSDYGPLKSLSTKPPSLGSVLSGGSIVHNPADASWLQNMTGYRTADGGSVGGWGMPAIGAATSVMGAYSGFQNMKNAKSALNFQKEAFSKQFENQRTLVNNELRDRDATRARRDPSYQSTTQFA